MNTVLTDEQVVTLACQIDAQPEITMMRQFARSIEQAVLQSPEVQALRKDAERYRFLRDEAETSPRDVFGTHWLVGLPEPVSLDSAIDAALEDQP